MVIIIYKHTSFNVKFKSNLYVLALNNVLKYENVREIILNCRPRKTCSLLKPARI